MNRKLFTTDEFGRSVDQGSERYDITKALKKYRYVSPYNRYFEGYKAVLAPAANGRKAKAVRIYVGPLYRQELPQKKCVATRVTYAALFLLAAAAFILAMMLPTASNYSWYAVMAAIVPAVFYGRLLLALNLYAFSGRELKIHEYKDGSRRLISTARHINRAMLVPMIATGVLLFLDSGAYSTLELLRLFLFVVSAAAAKVIGRLESKVEYTELPGEDAGDGSLGKP